MAVGEWDRRELCPDGGCVGVIGSDGHCKVCKRAVTNWGNERERGLKTDEDKREDDEELEDEVDGNEDDDDEYEDDESDDEDDDGDDEDDDDDGDDEDDDEDDGAMNAIAPSAPAAIGGAAVWNERQLCSDGGCIGVLGEDGLCKVCGKGKKRVVKAALSPVLAAKPAPLPEPAAPAKSTEEDSELLAAATDLAASLVEDRKLCPDGACVGVIGSDGKCKVCGQEAA